MSKKPLTSVAFKGTPEQKEELLRLINSLKDKEGFLMPIMQGAQDIYGYLPFEVQEIISEETGVPLEKIFGVATFYTQFNLNPKGKYNVALCMGTACYVKGAGEVFEELQAQLGIENGKSTSDGVFSLEATRCLGCCGLAPVMMVNDDVYGNLKKANVKGILDQYRS